MSRFNNMPLSSRLALVFLFLLPVLMTYKVPADITATLAGIGVLVWLWRNPGERHFRAPWFGAILLLWVFMLLVAAPLSIKPDFAFSHAFIFIRWPLFALCLTLVFFRQREGLERFETAALVWCLFIMLDSLFQYGVGFDLLGHGRQESFRLTGPFSKELPGIYSLRLYPIAMAGLLGVLQRRQSRWLAHSLIAFAFLAELFSFLSGERIVFLLFSLINLAVIIAVVRVLKPSRWLVGGGVAVLAVGIVGVALFAQNMVARTIDKFVSQISDFHNTDYYSIFVSAINVWRQNPVTGVGTGYYHEACEQYHFVSYFEGCVEHPHNIYLQWLCENGVIGLLLFVLFLFLLFRQIIRGLDFARQPLLSLLVLIAPLAIFWPVMTSMSMFANNYGELVWLSVGWAVARSQVARAG